MRRGSAAAFSTSRSSTARTRRGRLWPPAQAAWTSRGSARQPRQHRHQGARRDFLRHPPGGQQGDAEPGPRGQMRGVHAVGAEAAMGFDRDATAIRAVQGQQAIRAGHGQPAEFVAGQVLRRLRHAGPLQVGGRGEEREIDAAELAGDQRLLADRAEADGEVDPVLDQIDRFRVQPRLQRQAGIRQQEVPEPGQHDGVEEGGDAGDADAAGQRRLGAAGIGFGFLQAVEDADRLDMKGLAGLGGGEAARRAQQQWHAEPLFQLGDDAGDAGLAHRQVARRAGDVPGLHHAAEDRELLQPVHQPEQVRPQVRWGG